MPLLKRAAMTIFEFNTDVTRSSDGSDRALMVCQPICSDWSDCIAIHKPVPTIKGGWEELVVLSPARARIVAEQLLMRAERIEKRENAKYIDKPEEAV